MQWKNEYNKIIITVSVFSFIVGAIFNLTPFFYSKDFLVSKTQEDLSVFVKTDKTIQDTRFSFLKKEKNGISCAYSKYAEYAICSKGGVK